MSTPRLGQAFVSSLTADHPVEWVVVAVAEVPAPALLVVPADTSPAVGSVDVAVSPAAAGAPLVLRGRFALWVRPGLFEAQLMTRTVPDEDCRAAAAKHQAFLVGKLAGEALELETDEDLEYRQWLAEEIAPAHRALAAGQASFVDGEAEAPANAQPRAPVSSRLSWAPALAASLGAVGLGLGLWAFQLRQRVDELSAPIANLAQAVVLVGDTTRSELEVELPASSTRFLLVLQLDSRVQRFKRFQLEVTASGAGPATPRSFELEAVVEGELTVVLEAPRRQEEILALRLLGVEPGPVEDLGTRKLALRRRPPG